MSEASWKHNNNPSDGQSIARGWVELYMSIWKAYKPIHMGICSVLSQI